MFRNNMQRGVVALVLAAASFTAHAQSTSAHEAPRVLCSVTDEQIRAVTSRELVMLDTQSCTMSLAWMVDTTMGRIRKSYAAFYRRVAFNSEQVTEVSRLLVRRELLSTGWSAGPVEHYTVSKDPALLNEIEARLREYLDVQQLAALKRYEETVPARMLMEPVTSRLARSARPLSEPEHEAAVRGVLHLISEWHNTTSAEPQADPLQVCRDSHTSMNRRDEGIREILWRSLDEEQRQIAQGYYDDLFGRRARELRMYEDKLAANDDAICAVAAL